MLEKQHNSSSTVYFQIALGLVARMPALYLNDLVNKSSQPSFYTLKLYYGLVSISFFSFSEGNISSLEIPSARIIELATKIEE